MACHGPGCKRQELEYDEFFCSEWCQAMWHAELNEEKKPVEVTAEFILLREVRRTFVSELGREYLYDPHWNTWLRSED